MQVGVSECPIELLPAYPAQLHVVVQRSHSCFTGRSKLYNLKAYTSDVTKNKPWMTSGILISTRKCKMLYKNFGEIKQTIVKSHNIIKL